MSTGKAIARDCSPLALLRQRNGFTQRRVAKKLKVSFEYLCRVERGATGASERVVKGLSRVYDVQPDRIIRLNREAAVALMEASLGRKR